MATTAVIVVGATGRATARRISAEHCFRLNVAHFTATASTLILAECCAMCRQVGIGVLAPTAPLHVHGADSGITISSAVTDRPHLSLMSGTTEKLRLSANSQYGAIGDEHDPEASHGVGEVVPVEDDVLGGSVPGLGEDDVVGRSGRFGVVPCPAAGRGVVALLGDGAGCVDGAHLLVSLDDRGERRGGDHRAVGEEPGDRPEDPCSEEEAGDPVGGGRGRFHTHILHYGGIGHKY